MKNIILTVSMILIPFIALTGSIEEINRLMDKIKTNCEYLKITIEHDINNVLELEHKK